MTITPASHRTRRAGLGICLYGNEGSTTCNGQPCARNLAMCIHDDLEGHISFQENLLRLLFDGIACKRSAGVGATLRPVTAQIYIYNLSSLYRPDPWVVIGVFPPRASASPSYPESILAELFDGNLRLGLLGCLSRPRQVLPSRLPLEYRDCVIEYNPQSCQDAITEKLI